MTISLGGDGASNLFSSDSQASQFADKLWNLFLGGASDTRPFGNVVLDGYVPLLIHGFIVPANRVVIALILILRLVALLIMLL